MPDVRILIVDDEPLVRRGLRRMLAAEPGVVVAGEARHGVEALERIAALEPDLVFLDVQMPELDGLGVVRALAGRPLPGIVFVTAFDRYAVQAFDHHAIDYLLKPFDEVRLRTALARARERLATSSADALAARMSALLDGFAAREGLTRFAVRTGARVAYVDADDVDWLEAADNYVVLHAGAQRHVVRDTLKRLERQLDPDRFVRIHRSAIVQLARVRELSAQPSGDATLVLADGARLTLSRRYRAAFDARAGRPR